MIKYEVKGDFSKTNRFLESLLRITHSTQFDKYGRRGVDALRNSIPKDTGLASESWDYEIVRTKDSVTINWFNTDVENGYKVAILVQYGHGTKNGGYIQGRDYINPAMRPIFDEMADSIWKEVSK